MMDAVLVICHFGYTSSSPIVFLHVIFWKWKYVDSVKRCIYRNKWKIDLIFQFKWFYINFSLICWGRHKVPPIWITLCIFVTNFHSSCDRPVTPFHMLHRSSTTSFFARHYLRDAPDEIVQTYLLYYYVVVDAHLSFKTIHASYALSKWSSSFISLLFVFSPFSNFYRFHSCVHGLS